MSNIQRKKPYLTPHLPKIPNTSLEQISAWSLPVPQIDTSRTNSDPKLLDFDQIDYDDGCDIAKQAEMQRIKMNTIILNQTDEPTKIVHLRVPLISEQRDGFKSFQLPINVIALSETLLHISKSSGKALSHY